MLKERSINIVPRRSGKTTLLINKYIEELKLGNKYYFICMNQYMAEYVKDIIKQNEFVANFKNVDEKDFLFPNPYISYKFFNMQKHLDETIISVERMANKFSERGIRIDINDYKNFLIDEYFFFKEKDKRFLSDFFKANSIANYMIYSTSNKLYDSELLQLAMLYKEKKLTKTQYIALPYLKELKEYINCLITDPKANIYTTNFNHYYNDPEKYKCDVLGELYK